MIRIQQLSKEVITKIAAGEVIERPASVVKELLENSLDASSTRIEVDIEQGGTELIRVVDNGRGIQAEDLALAFASHATSKLASADDLFQIGTFGFRGEALASVGGVSQIKLQSRPADQPSGGEIFGNAGQYFPVRVWNGAPGTRIEVMHLFFNTPVRRKFLRSTATESGHICEAFTRIALAQSSLHLILRHNGKLTYEVPGAAGLRDRIGIFFGAEIRDHLYAVEAHQGPVTLRGFIGDPVLEKGNAKMQYLFINRRCIRDRNLSHALQEAYRGLLMSGRYAVAFLFLDLPPDQVDVNVHPTKSEVRFRDSQSLYHLILTAIRERLRKENLTARLQIPHGRQVPAPLSPGQKPTANSLCWQTDSLPDLPEPQPTPPPGRTAAALRPEGNGAGSDTDFPLPMSSGDSRSENGAEIPCAAVHAAGAGVGKAIQVHDSYIVLETPEGMLVIDQHALHERILFEQLKERLRTGRLEVQRLLIPEPVDLPAAQAARVLEQREALAELGVGVEDFGGGTILLTSYPAILSRRTPLSILQAILDHLMMRDRIPNREVLLGDLLSLMACHGAVRAGDRLTPEELSALVAQREWANDTHHCPHGRPTSLLFSKQELDRQFRRI